MNIFYVAWYEEKYKLVGIKNCRIKHGANNSNSIECK